MLPLSCCFCPSASSLFCSSLQSQQASRDTAAVKQPAIYTEHLLSYGHWIGSTVLFRPKLRLEHSYNKPAYDLGTRKTQFVVAGDLTYHF